MKFAETLCRWAALLLFAALVGCAGNTPESLVSSAKEYLAKGDTNSAIIQLKAALQQTPNFPEARFLLGRALLETGDPTGAEIELRRAIDLKYPSAGPRALLAKAMLQKGDYQRVVSEFKDGGTGVAAEDAELLAAVGEAQLNLGELGLAARSFDAAVDKQPGLASALLGKARLLAARGEYQQALDLVEKATTTEGSSSEAWQLKGDVLATLQRHDQAIDSYEHAVNLRSGNLAARSGLIRAALAFGKPDLAKRQLAAMQKVAASHPETLYLQALIAYDDKSFKDAQQAIERSLAVYPDYAAALALSGVIAYELKNYAQAETALRRVLQTAPRNLFARRALIATYLAMGNARAALDTLTPVAGAIDRDPDMLLVAGDVYLRNGRLTDASAALSKASELRPNDNRALAGLALAHLAAGDTQRGVRELEAAASKDEEGRIALTSFSVSLQRREFDKALALADSLQKKQPSKPQPYTLRGMVLLEQRDISGARHSFERALAMDGKFMPAAANLARLDLIENKPEDAKRRFESIASSDPRNVQALLGLAWLTARQKGSAEEVRKWIDQAIAAAPQDPAPRSSLVGYYLTVKDNANALKAAQDAVQVFPDNPAVLEALGLAQRAAGKTREAVATYSRLAVLQGESASSLSKVAQAQAAAKEYDQALQTLKKTLALNPDDVAAHREIAAVQLALERVPDALNSARDMQVKKPNDPAGFILEGDVHASQKSWSKAIAAYQAALKKGDSPQAAIRLEFALRANGQKGEAESFASNWLRSHASDTTFRTYIAQSALARGEFAVATGHYQQLAAVQPNNPVVFNNLAWAAYASGHGSDQAALDNAERANKLAPNQPAILDTLGLILLARGSADRAVEVLQMAVGLAPSKPSHRLHLAKALLKAGKSNEAKVELQKLSKMEGDLPERAEALELLKSL